VLADGLLSDTDENNLVALEDEFQLTQTELDQKGAYTKVVQAHVLRELADGKLPDKFGVKGNLPFNMQRGAQSVKPQTFVLGDGWFVYNLAVNLSSLNQ